MRITGGQYRGRSFEPPKVSGFRPTMEKVRLAVFSMLDTQMDLAGCLVLDCYSGSGAFGLESLSRGAESCTFIEKNPELLKFTTSIAEKLGVLSSTRFIRDTLPEALGKLNKEFDLVFADPPYDTDSGGFFVKLLASNVLKTAGLLVIETSKTSKVDIEQQEELSIELLRDKGYGDTRVRIFRKK